MKDKDTYTPEEIGEMYHAARQLKGFSSLFLGVVWEFATNKDDVDTDSSKVARNLATLLLDSYIPMYRNVPENIRIQFGIDDNTIEEKCNYVLDVLGAREAPGAPTPS